MTKARDIASAAPAPAGVTSTELGYIDGVTSAIQTQVDAKIAKTLTTTTGDIIYASGANTPARLGIGSSAQVLSVSGGVPAWTTPAAGGMTLINTGGTSLTGGTTTVSSIPNTYKELKIYITDWYSSVQSTPEFYLNTDTTIGNYSYNGTRLFGSSSSVAVIGAQDTSIVYIGVPAAQNDNHLVITIPNYADTTVKKVYTAHAGVVDAGTNSVTMTAHKWNNTAAIDAINFKTGSGTWSAGTIYVYGVK